jgi:ribosome-associated protein
MGNDLKDDLQFERVGSPWPLPGWHPAEDEYRVEVFRAGGPGGQRLNKVSTAVRLRFDLAGAHSLAEDVKARVRRLAGRRLTSDGEVLLEAQQSRSQAQNRRQVMERLQRMVGRAAMPPKKRRRTEIPGREREARLRTKRGRAEVKARRRPIPPGDT